MPLTSEILAICSHDHISTGHTILNSNNHVDISVCKSDGSILKLRNVITHIFKNQLLWSEFRWRLRYYSHMYKFVLQLGSQNANLHSQIYKLLAEIRFKYPRKRAEELFTRVLRIAESTRLDDGY